MPSAVVTTSTILPTIQARPSFVLETLPRESQVLRLSEFEAIGEPIELVDDWDTVTIYDSQICLKIDNYAQAGDDFTDPVKVVERVTLLVDSKPVDEIGAGGVTLEAIRVVDSDGQILMQGVGPQLVCGKTDLQIGFHEVMFQFRQTSGNLLEYQWKFELTE
ncbi:MAG: hypothetical protein HC804_01475 [Anaerolineae bacterium]|nr:hypothetical protein [Anaerolineae bacterium]